MQLNPPVTLLLYLPAYVSLAVSIVLMSVHTYLYSNLKDEVEDKILSPTRYYQVFVLTIPILAIIVMFGYDVLLTDIAETHSPSTTYGTTLATNYEPSHQHYQIKSIESTLSKGSGHLLMILSYTPLFQSSYNWFI